MYVVVVYEYDSNAILAEPIKNSQAETIRDVFRKIYRVLKARCSKQKLYIMYNDCSSDLNKL